MNATCGLKCDDSSLSAGLQRSLESKLRAALDVNGSPEYVLTWKHWDMPSGPPICALRARGRPTSGNGCSGWPTPAVTNADRGGMIERTEGERRNLQDFVLLAGWATPSANEMRTKDPDRLLKRREECKVRTGNGNGFGLTLGNQATLFLASTAEHGALNPEFVRWLMGFPHEWGSCAPTGTQSSRKSRPSSSERS